MVGSQDSKRRLFIARSHGPGEVVIVSGVYRVVHETHRPDHTVLALSGDVLPECRVCRAKVRFTLETETEYATHDWDLAGPVLNIKKAASE